MKERDRRMGMKYRLIRLLFTIIIRTAAKIRVTGLENVPISLPFILAINHLTVLEPPLLLVVLPIKINVFVGRKWETYPIFGYLLRQLDAIFVNRRITDRQALRTAIKVLKSGEVLGMAPEGRRSDTGGLMPAKPGVAYLATKTNVPILPVGISGQVGWAEKVKRLQRLSIDIAVGELIHLPALSGPDKGETLQKYADEVMVHIAHLVAPELRGAYASHVEETNTADFRPSQA